MSHVTDNTNSPTAINYLSVKSWWSWSYLIVVQEVAFTLILGILTVSPQHGEMCELHSEGRSW